MKLLAYFDIFGLSDVLVFCMDVWVDLDEFALESDFVSIVAKSSLDVKKSCSADIVLSGVLFSTVAF